MSTNSGYEKRYYSASLDEILSKYVTSKRYGELVPVIKDIFQRRAYEYDFSDKHIESEVRNFIRKAKKVKFVPETEFEKSSIMGLYSPNKKRITLNETHFSKKFGTYDALDVGEDMYEVLTHEIYHAISDRPINLGVSTYNIIKNDYEGNALNEAITEVSANRVSFTRNNNDFERGSTYTDGYTDITFVVNFLAASIGVTEKEFLRAGIQNRKELMKLFNSKFPSNSVAKTAKKDFFDKIESSLDLLHNLNYEKKDPEEPKEVRSQLRKSALTTLYKSAYELAHFQISHDKSHKGIEFSDEVSFRFLKLENILMDSSKYFQDRNYISRQDYHAIHDEIYQSRQILGADVLRLARKTSFSEMNKADVYRNSYAKKIMKEDFDNRKSWNNYTVSRAMLDEYDRTLEAELEEFESTGPVPIVDDDTELVPIVDDQSTSKRITEPVPVIYDDTEPVPIVNYENTSQRITEKVPVVGNGNTSQRITEKVATVGNNTKANEKNLIDKFKQTIDIIITRFKNRKLAKLNGVREDKSEYYANLVNNTRERIKN